MFFLKIQKKTSFLKMYSRNHRFLAKILKFLRENWLKKILKLYSKSNFWRITLKNVNMLLKN